MSLSLALGHPLFLTRPSSLIAACHLLPPRRPSASRSAQLSSVSAYSSCERGGGGGKEEESPAGAAAPSPLLSARGRSRQGAMLARSPGRPHLRGAVLHNETGATAQPATPPPPALPCRAAPLPHSPRSPTAPPQHKHAQAERAPKRTPTSGRPFPVRPGCASPSATSQALRSWE